MTFSFPLLYVIICLEAHLGKAMLPFSPEKVLQNVSKNKLVNKKCCDIDLVWASDITIFWRCQLFPRE